MQAALAELNEGRKIINVACEFGFETPSGFSKAMKRNYGKTPSQLKQSMLLKEAFHTEMKELEGFDLCGYAVDMDFSATNYSEGMLAYWTTFEENNIEEQLYTSLDPSKHGEIGIIIRDENNSGKHKYLLGVLKWEERQDTRWLQYHIAGGKYVVITTPPVDMTSNDIELATMVKMTWKYIFEQWFETVDFQFDETREAFEYYDERCHYRKDAIMNIFIPIK